MWQSLINALKKMTGKEITIVIIVVGLPLGALAILRPNPNDIFDFVLNVKANKVEVVTSKIVDSLNTKERNDIDSVKHEMWIEHIIPLRHERDSLKNKLRQLE